ncbi:hypothetical protein M422DRAFT_239039 [Sphaerobolus stellatus SS14]|nr:hypothetical protein M422DRAFT_239039 [Sphaerobolus stellatus SS14]
MPVQSFPMFGSLLEVGFISNAIEQGSTSEKQNIELIKVLSAGGPITEEICLPTESFGEIFKWLVAMTDCDSLTTPVSPPFVFTQVSRLWRSIAFSLQELWGYLGIGPRSNFNIYQVINMYLTHCSPTRSLTISAFPPIPAQDEESQDVQTIFRISSMLVNAVNILANEGVILLSLESVVLDISVASYDALEQFLDNCPMLKQLRITVAPVVAFQGDTSIKETSLFLLEQLELKLPFKFNPYQLFTV